MLRPCAGILLSLTLMAPTLVMAAPETGNKDSSAAAEAMDKTQTQLKDAALLEVQAWRLASQFYLYGAQGKTASEMSQLQKIRSAGARLSNCCGAKVRSGWDQVATSVMEGSLDDAGKPSPGTHKKIHEALTVLTAALEEQVAEIRKSAKLPARGPAEALQDTSVRFEKLVFNHFSGEDDPEQRKLMNQVNSRFDSLGDTYKIGETGKAVQSACAKWPVLREALNKAKDKNPVFIISRFHDQVSQDLHNALENQPRY